MRNALYILAAILTVIVVEASTADAANVRVGKQSAAFTIPDCYGKQVILSDFKDSKILVVAFVGTDCPLVKLYGARLDELAKKYAGAGGAGGGITSTQQDQPRKIVAHARQYGMTFPILKDLDN